MDSDGVIRNSSYQMQENTINFYQQLKALRDKESTFVR